MLIKRISGAAVFLLIVINVAGAQAAPVQSTAANAVAALTGNHPGELSTLRPVGHADFSTRLNMTAVLGLRNQPALDQLLRDQQNPASPQYHRWLTPAQFVARFGPAPHDVDAAAQWLNGQGFKITAASAARGYVRFSGTVADAERVFSTSIMTFGDGTIYSNVTDPLIPAQFRDVISAITGLDNFLRSVPLTDSLQSATAGTIGSPPQLLESGPMSWPENATSTATPDVIIKGTRAFGPSDFRTFYNENPLIAANVDGRGGDCIAIVGTSNYTAGAVNLFNSTFTLPASNITTVLVEGFNPGFNNAQDEALLDLEWSHAVAPGAADRYYLGNNSVAPKFGNTIVDAISAAVSDNLCGVISVSFSLCGFSPTFFPQVVSPIYAQAASQGQSVFISSGDQGAAGLIFNGTSCAAATSRHVNELGADPNVTEVGGTGFIPNFDQSGRDVGNVPESVWNDSVAHPGGGATGGGVSSVYSKPSYQIGPGVPHGGMRDVPDIALIASPYLPGSFWGSTSNGSPIIKCCIGGTSLSAPAWAGIAKLIAQLNHGRTGPLNRRIYALANAGQATSGFRDVTSGNNDFNGVMGFDAGPGFDLSTGWGTVDIDTFAHDYVSPPSPSINPVPSPILVGSSFNISGSYFSPGAVVNFFVATSNGPVNYGPLTPSSRSSTSLTVPVPTTVPLGQGFVAVEVVNADLVFKASNTEPALLQGSAGAGIPSLKFVNGVGLAPTSSDAKYATNNVQTVIMQGASITLGGSGFDALHGVAVNIFCACPGDNAGPVFVPPGTGGLTSTSFHFTLPASVPTGPSSLAVINAGPFHTYTYSSNAVSVPVGGQIAVSHVSQSGGTITVTGTGFSKLTVINFFNKQGLNVVDFGGLDAGGNPKIHLNLIDSTKFTFTRPMGTIPGPAYVQALNPPFVPYTSSGTDPGGDLLLL